MELTFAQAAKGVNKEMTVHIEDMCQRCGGRGHEPGSKVQHCGSCNGTGMVSDALERISSFRRVWWLCICGSSLQETVNTGPFVMRSTCRRCGGRGSVITSPCTACRGTGQTKQRRTVTVPVPAGELAASIQWRDTGFREWIEFWGFVYCDVQESRMGRRSECLWGRKRSSLHSEWVHHHCFQVSEACVVEITVKSTNQNE